MDEEELQQTRRWSRFCLRNMLAKRTAVNKVDTRLNALPTILNSFIAGLVGFLSQAQRLVLMLIQWGNEADHHGAEGMEKTGAAVGWH